MELVEPNRDALPSYRDAIRAGWDWDTFFLGSPEHILTAEDPDALLAPIRDGDHAGEPLNLPDGRVAVRLPSIVRWMWDDGFVGSINLRWLIGTPELPADVLGHIGYGTVPRARGKGYATEALRQALPLLWQQGLPYADIVTDPDNVISQRVIEHNGGERLGTFLDSVGSPVLRWRVMRP